MLTVLDEKCVGLAKTFRESEAAILGVLMEIEEVDGFRELGFRNLFDYCRSRLGLSEAQSAYYSRVSKKSLVVPALKEAIEDGKINLSQARRIESVVTPENCEAWIEKAETLPQRDLEKAVTQENPRAKVTDRLKPVGENLIELKAGLTHEQEKAIRRVQDLLSQKLKKPATLQDVMAAMADCYLEKHDPIKKAERIASSGRKTKVTPPKSSHFIPAHIKHEVSLRDRGVCQHFRCNQTRWLDIHHILEVSRGGLTEVDNLITLCTYHHRRRHEQAHEAARRAAGCCLGR